MPDEPDRLEACVRKEFQSMYPDMLPGRWYPVSARGRDHLRPEGATRSGGGPTSTAGVWVTVDGVERFLFGHHVTVRPVQEPGAQVQD